MSRTGDEKNVEIVLLDHAVHVNIGKRLSSIGTPVPQQTRLDVVDSQRFLEQRVVFEVERPQTEVQTGMPVSDDLGQLILG